MTAIYLLVLAVLAVDHHGHWSQLHPWTAWFVILVVVAIADLVVHRSVLSRTPRMGISPHSRTVSAPSALAVLPVTPADS